jgi:Protein of unknown function (DUF3168)
MSVEATVFATLQGLVAGRCYPDVAPEATARPYLTYQAVGGTAVNFISQAPPGRVNTRMQISVWADTRAQASTVARQAEDALRGVAALQTTVMGAPVAIYETDTRLRGSQQDFSFWAS